MSTMDRTRATRPNGLALRRPDTTKDATISWTVRAGAITEPVCAAWLAPRCKAGESVVLSISTDAEEATDVNLTTPRGDELSLWPVLEGAGFEPGPCVRSSDQTLGLHHLDIRLTGAHNTGTALLRATLQGQRVLYAQTCVLGLLGVSGGRYEVASPAADV